MSDRQAEERIAQLLARAQAQRLAAQLAIIEAQEQLAPLRSGMHMVRAVAGAFAPGRAADGVVSALAKFGLGHPWLVSAVGAAVLRAALRRPLALVLAVAVGAAVRWLRQGAAPAQGEQRAS